MVNFKNKKLKEIKIWTWAAAVLPITALATTFFVWRMAPTTWFDWLLITGEVCMFSVAVVWWWWAMWTMLQIINQWEDTKSKVVEVQRDVKEVKNVIEDLLSLDK